MTGVRSSAAFQLAAFLGVLFMCAGSAQATEYRVNPDGSGAFLTIQACANAAKPGDRCLVSPGVYSERVKTVSGGTSETSRITFKASGVVTMQGFQVSHAYITIDGFDITGYTTKWGSFIELYYGADHCNILNNTVRDSTLPIYGIYFKHTTGYGAADYAIIRGNTIARIAETDLLLNGSHHLVENNVFEYLGNDFLRLWGSDSVIRRNIFRYIMPGINGHNDFMQTYGFAGAECQNILIEENWIQDMNNGLTGYMAQMNSSDGDVNAGILYDTIKNITFRRNVFMNVRNSGSIDVPYMTFENNTFYQCATAGGGYNFSGSLTRGDPGHATIKNNVFLACGNSAGSLNGQNGFYNFDGFPFSSEAISVKVTLEGQAGTGGGPTAKAIYADMVSHGYLVQNTGEITIAAKALARIDDMLLNSAYGAFKNDLWKYLQLSISYDNTARATFLADYNYVGGSAAAGYPPKKSAECNYAQTSTRLNFCEPHGINGGDPQLADIANPLGPDGIPFTVDDGLKPRAGSTKLCRQGEGGVDIGAYSCDPNKVFPNQPRPPANLVIR